MPEDDYREEVLENMKRSFQALDVFSKIPLNGIILTPVMDTITLKFEYLGMLEKLKVPLVLVDRDLQYSHFDGVFLDNVYGGFDATMALIKAGHTKIATITGTHSSLTGHDRLTGYKKAMQIQRLNLRKEYIKSGEFTIEGGYRGIKELMDMPDPPTAIFVANSVMMKGVLRLIQERNMRIPEDIATLTFDDFFRSSDSPIFKIPKSIPCNLHPNLMRPQCLHIFRGELRIGYNRVHLLRGEHLSHTALSELIRGGENNDLVRLLCQSPNSAAAGVIDISKAVFLRIAIDAHKNLIYIILLGTELRHRPGGDLGYRVVITAQQNHLDSRSSSQRSGNIGGVGNNCHIIYSRQLRRKEGTGRAGFYHNGFHWLHQRDCLFGNLFFL